MAHMSPVTCHLSTFTCHQSPVSCHLSYLMFVSHRGHSGSPVAVTCRCHLSPERSYVCFTKRSHLVTCPTRRRVSIQKDKVWIRLIFTFLKKDKALSILSQFTRQLKVQDVFHCPCLALCENWMAATDCSNMTNKYQITVRLAH